MRYPDIFVYPIWGLPAFVLSSIKAAWNLWDDIILAKRARERGILR